MYLFWSDFLFFDFYFYFYLFIYFFPFFCGGPSGHSDQSAGFIALPPLDFLTAPFFQRGTRLQTVIFTPSSRQR